MKNANEILSRGRFTSRHIGAEMCYDDRHQVIKTSFTGGGHGELIKELQPDGRYRDQVLFIVSPDGARARSSVSTVQGRTPNSNKGRTR